MNKVVIANFKMNKTIDETLNYVKALSKKLKPNVTVGFCPPYTALASAVKDTKESGILVGAQNIHEEDKGAYTGEISASMVKETGATFTLVGHSERRKYNKETDKVVNTKIMKALKAGLEVVLCIGESLNERNRNETNDVLTRQLYAGLKDVYGNELKYISIAYEPVWAIGTGKIPTVKQIEEAMKIIRNNITALYSKELAGNMVVLYGGSVDPVNSKEISKVKGVSGALVGGAGLDPDKFGDIIANFS